MMENEVQDYQLAVSGAGALPHFTRPPPGASFQPQLECMPLGHTELIGVVEAVSTFELLLFCQIKIP